MSRQIAVKMTEIGGTWRLYLENCVCADMQYIGTKVCRVLVWKAYSSVLS